MQLSGHWPARDSPLPPSTRNGGRWLRRKSKLPTLRRNWSDRRTKALASSLCTPRRISFQMPIHSFLDSTPLPEALTLPCTQLDPGQSDSTLVSRQWRRATSFTDRTWSRDSKGCLWLLILRLIEDMIQIMRGLLEMWEWQVLRLIRLRIWKFCLIRFHWRIFLYQWQWMELYYQY